MLFQGLCNRAWADCLSDCARNARSAAFATPLKDRISTTSIRKPTANVLTSMRSRENAAAMNLPFQAGRSPVWRRDERALTRRHYTSLDPSQREGDAEAYTDCAVATFPNPTRPRGGDAREAIGRIPVRLGDHDHGRLHSFLRERRGDDTRQRMVWQSAARSGATRGARALCGLCDRPRGTGHDGTGGS